MHHLDRVLRHFGRKVNELIWQNCSVVLIYYPNQTRTVANGQNGDLDIGAVRGHPLAYSLLQIQIHIVEPEATHHLYPFWLWYVNRSQLLSVVVHVATQLTRYQVDGAN